MTQAKASDLLYTQAAQAAAESVTRQYSTSFSLALKLIDPQLRPAIYSVYGYVRVADELVDSWRPKAMGQLLDEFEAETFRAIKHHYSLNPIVFGFAKVVNDYQLDHKLIKAFLASMRMDVDKRAYTAKQYQAYIYGSAEVVGLMCLSVFCGGNQKQYKRLLPAARALGAAFQKVNFLRDLGSDNSELGRVYFPGLEFKTFDDNTKQKLVADALKDFKKAHTGIRRLPASSRAAVWLAYRYYLALTRKIARTPAAQLTNQRVSVRGAYKLWLFFQAWVWSWWLRLSSSKV